VLGKSLLENILEIQKKAWEGAYDPSLAQNLVAEVVDSLKHINLAGFPQPNQFGPVPGHIPAVPVNISQTEEDIGNITRVNIRENTHEIFLSMFLPGIISKEDLSLKLQSDALIISGWYREDPPSQGEKLPFKRTVRLPAETGIQGASASYRNQYLTVRLPKKTPGNARDIDVTFF